MFEAAVVEAAGVTRHEFTTATFARPQHSECRVKPPFLTAPYFDEHLEQELTEGTETRFLFLLCFLCCLLFEN